MSRIQVIDTKEMDFSIWKIARFPLLFFLTSIIFFTVAYFFFFPVFKVFLILNTIIIIITTFYTFIFGVIPHFFKYKSVENYSDNSQFVSIIIPVFNDGAVLEKNLHNLLTLKYPHLEILVIYSTKSTDRTEDIALQFAEDYDHVHAFAEKISKGNASNIGIDNAKGEFLLFLDSDSFIHEGFIERALTHFSDKDVVLVNSCFLGLNSNQNIITRMGWSISNYIAFVAVGTNKFLHQINFTGFGGMWRKKALVECGKFAIHSSIEDAEINLRTSIHHANWKGIFDDQLFCYQFYPTSFKSFYLQLLRWTSGNIRYVAKGISKISSLGIRQKFIYMSQFLLGTVFPLISIFSAGMAIVQFFANFYYPDFSFGGGLFFLLVGFISLIIMFFSLLLYVYPKYHKNSRAHLSNRFIVVGICVMIMLVGFIFGLVSLNSVKLVLSRKKEDIFYKVDKTDVNLSNV